MGPRRGPGIASFLAVAIAIGLGVAILLGGSVASAQPVQVEFTGTVSTVSDPDGLAGGALAPGTPISGSYVLDPGAPGASGPGGTVYPGNFIDLSAGGLGLQAGLEIVVGDEPGSNGFDFIEMSGTTLPTPAAPGGFLIGLFFVDGSGTALSSESLVPTPDPGAFGDEAFLGIASGTLEARGSIDSLQVLPEPRAGLAFGALALAVLARHRKRRERAAARARHRPR